jgi:hypothetical protein
MPDDRVAEIEKRIDRDVVAQMQLAPAAGSTFGLVPRSMADVLEFAKLMAVSGICIRPMFRGNPGACLAVTLQAMKWGADPFAVANKAFEVNGQLSYESQLIHAIVNSSPALSRRLNATFSGEGPQRKCLVVGMIRGEDEAREYESPKMSDITPKNSPLWKTDPDQQLFYYSTRAWARRWVPEVLLGIYTPEELGPTIDLTPIGPEPQRQDFVEHTPEAEPEDEPPYTVVDLDGVEHGFREAATAEAALIAVLEAAAKMGLERLDGAWETNGKFDREDETGPIAHRYRELCEALTKPRRAAPERKKPDPAPDSPAASAPVAAPAQPAMAFPEGRFPGDPPTGNASAIAEAREVPGVKSNSGPVIDTPAETTSTERPPVRVLEPPIWHGKPDYRTYVIGLILPKVRQAKTVADLSYLLGDNDAHLTAARAALAKDDSAALDEAIALRFRELG